MNVKSSSSSIESARSSERSGCSAAYARPRSRSASSSAKRDDVRDARSIDLGALVVVLDEDAHRIRVLEQVLHVARRARRIDRRADGADEREREVEQRPLEARPREEAERLALLDAERQQAVRELIDGSSGFRPGDLDAIRRPPRAGRPGRDARPRPRPATDSRSSGRGPRGKSSREGTRSVGAKSGPPSIGFCLQMRTTWNGSISFGLVNIPVGLAPATKPAARQSDISFRMLHRECGTPIKQKRWCPVHEREVESDELVKGWEVAKGQFVTVEEADLEAIEKHDTSRSIEISRFVRARGGRPGLLRPHLLPRSRRSRGTAPSVRAAARGDEGAASPRSAGSCSPARRSSA